MDHNTSSIGDLINAFLKKRGLSEKMEEIDLNNNWEKVAGPLIARHTTSVHLKDKTLSLGLNSASLRHTLSFSKTEFIEKLNATLGADKVREIKLK